MNTQNPILPAYLEIGLVIPDSLEPKDQSQEVSHEAAYRDYYFTGEVEEACLHAGYAG